MPSEVVEASGHLIDSGILNGIFDTVIRHGASFEVLRFAIGRTNAEPSLLTMRVSADNEVVLRELIENLVPLGCLIVGGEDAVTRVADRDGAERDVLDRRRRERLRRLLQGRRVVRLRDRSQRHGAERRRA